MMFERLLAWSPAMAAPTPSSRMSTHAERECEVPQICLRHLVEYAGAIEANDAGHAPRDDGLFRLRKGSRVCRATVPHRIV
eukprot:267079-Prymnesium_polylepis.1